MTRDQFRLFNPFRIRYSEIDAQGVVFNAHYLTFYDTAITEYFRWLGYNLYADTQQTGADFHVVKALVEYKAPIPFDLEIEVGVRVARIGNSSLSFDLGIFPKGGDTLHATGELVWVNTDQTTHRPVPVPPKLRSLIEKRDAPVS